MQHVHVTRVFPASPERVWEVYTDHAGWQHWAGFSKSWLETEGTPDANGTGAVRGFASGGVEVFEKVLDFEAPQRMTYTVVRGGLPMKNHRGQVTLEPVDDGTLLIWQCRFDSKIPGLGWLMRVFVTRFFRTALSGLQRYAFSEAGRP